MNRILALILSSIYCGFGQIYKREILKGINFVIIYTALILSLAFLSHISQLAMIVTMTLLMLMWLIGMIDAYADDKIFIEGNHGLLWKTLIMVFIAIGIFGSVLNVTVLFVYPQLFLSSQKDSEPLLQGKPDVIKEQVLEEQNNITQNPVMNSDQNTSETQVFSIDIPKVEPKTSQPKMKEDIGLQKIEYYTVQVGMFSNVKNAENLADQLKAKGYSTVVINPSSDSDFYKVAIGKFDSKDGAAKFAEKLNRNKISDGAVAIAIQSQ